MFFRRGTRFQLPSCHMLGIFWVAIGLATLAYGEQFPMLRIESADYPGYSLYLSYLTALMSIIQGYWFSKSRGLVPFLGINLFLLLAVKISTGATLAVEHEVTRADWGSLFLIILMTMSLMGCTRGKRAAAPR